MHVFHALHEEDPLSSFGSLTVSNVRRWLEYYQLITVKKDRETYKVKRKPCFGKFKQDTRCSLLSKYSSWCGDETDCVKASSNPDEFDDTKTRNITIIRPAKRGFLAYENGLLIEVDWGSSPVKVGLGKPYPERAKKLHELAEEIWEKAKISQSRQGQWWSDLHEFCIGLLGLKRGRTELKVRRNRLCCTRDSWRNMTMTLVAENAEFSIHIAFSPRPCKTLGCKGRVGHKTKTGLCKRCTSTFNCVRMNERRRNGNGRGEKV